MKIFFSYIMLCLQYYIYSLNKKLVGFLHFFTLFLKRSRLNAVNYFHKEDPPSMFDHRALNVLKTHHMYTTERPFPCRFNVEYTWCVCRVCLCQLIRNFFVNVLLYILCLAIDAKHLLMYQ